MTEDCSDFVHLTLCDNKQRHRSHDWFDDGQRYKCIGFIGDLRETVPSGIIRKACDLKVTHTLHIWEVAFLDASVRYFCKGIEQ